MIYNMAKSQMPVHQANLSRTGHDIKGSLVSSMTTGIILPQYFHIMSPKETIYYKTELFARFQPIVTAFLGEVDIDVDYFFVPLQMLYTPFGQVFAQTDDFLSSTFGAMPRNDKFPVMDFIEPFDYGTAWTSNDGCGESYAKGAFRLLSHLDYNPYAMLDDTITGKSMPTDSPIYYYRQHPRVTPWSLLAYQACYQKYYRNEDTEKFDIAAYNIDQFYMEADGGYFVNPNAMYLRHAERPKDFFTRMRPSPISTVLNTFYGQANSESDSVNNFSSVLLKVNDYLGLYSSNYVTDYMGDSPETSPNSSFGMGSVSSVLNDDTRIAPFTAQNIRALFAVDKFARIYGRADKTYDAQILAHFGVDIPHDVKHDITHISHFRMTMQADPVINTANTAVMTDGGITGSPLGEVGAQSVQTMSTNGDKFTAPVHGVFIACMYATTRPRYYNTFSKLNTLNERLDFPIPEYYKLGSRPLYSFEYCPYFNAGAGSIRKGWIDRYQEYKEKYDRVSPTFVQLPSQKYFNSYAPWVLSRQAYDFDGLDGQFPAWQQLKESTHSLDKVMMTAYESGWSDAYLTAPWLICQTDPIITAFKCDAKLVSSIPASSEPDL